MATYLGDGERGLDFGTGIYNLPQSSEVVYTVGSISGPTIDDDVPDIFVNQMGQVSDNDDVFRFIDAAGNTVGNEVAVSFSNIDRAGVGNFKFYKPNSDGDPEYTERLRGTRDLRAIALKLSDFGITSANAGSIRSFGQSYSGGSDQAFIAYNTAAISLYQSVTGTIYLDNDDDDTPNGDPYEGATIILYDANNNEVTRVTSDPNGRYEFGNIEPGDYFVQIVPPDGYSVVSSSDGDGNDRTAITVGSEEPVSDVSFGIAEDALSVKFGTITAFLSGDELQVDWETLTEENNSHFEIQISRDGKEFKTISTVKTLAKDGNSSGTLNYSTTANIGGAAGLAGISLLGFALLLSVFARKHKFLLVLLTITGASLITVSCKKTPEGVDRADEKLYVRIMEVDKNGTAAYSKVVHAVKEK